MMPPYAIDVFAPFMGNLVIRGWVAAPKGTRLELKVGDKVWALTSFGLPSPDVALVHPGMDQVRFEETVAIGEFQGVIHQAVLVVRPPDGEAAEIFDLASVLDHARHRQVIFAEELSKRPPGSLLELGSRARSGIVNTAIVPTGWDYVGLDIHEGENVDVVGDAHELSSLFPERRFDAVMSFSVVEHLLMPWKVVIELNRVMNIGAIGLFTTHQAWPLHDAPWDFWRFSKESWAALFNAATGFEIVGAEVGEPGYVVPQRCHAATNFGEQPVYLSSVVMFRKTRETSLRWDVTTSDVVSTAYPSQSIPMVR